MIINRDDIIVNVIKIPQGKTDFKTPGTNESIRNIQIHEILFFFFFQPLWTHCEPPLNPLWTPFNHPQQPESHGLKKSPPPPKIR